MPGNATIGTNLVDSLLGMVDDLRGSLNPDMGVRQWRVYVVSRLWTGGRIGDGTFVDTETELLPQPLISSYELFYGLSPAGLTESGKVVASEVSLTYTEAELKPSPVAGEEIMYLLRDAHGQGIAPRYFVLSGPPKPDRTNTIGWILDLKEVQVDGCG